MKKVYYKYQNEILSVIGIVIPLFLAYISSYTTVEKVLRYISLHWSYIIIILLLIYIICQRATYRRKLSSQIQVFDNFSSIPQSSLIKAVQESKNIKICMVRGFPVTHEGENLNNVIFEHYDSRKKEGFKILLADPDCPAAKERAKEYRKIATRGMENLDTYTEQVKSSIKYILDMKDKFSNVELRLYSVPAVFRIVIFDNFCLVGFYTNKWTGITTPVVSIDKTVPLYDGFVHFFDKTWEKSRNNLQP